MLDPVHLPAAEAAHESLERLERELEEARKAFDQAVRRLHASGATLREIAEHFGISHQRVHQIVSATGREPTRRRLRERLLGGLERFDRDAKSVAQRAQVEARGLGHTQVGTEHVLLALLAVPDGPAARVLRRLGVGHEAVREGVVAAVGAGTPLDEGEPLPLTPRARKVFEQSLREALELRANSVGTEHVLLGLFAEPAGLAARLLRELGADADRVREEVRRG